MGVYNGPSEGQFIELKRKVDAQFEQMLSLRADIQQIIQLIKMAVILLDKRSEDRKNER